MEETVVQYSAFDSALQGIAQFIQGGGIFMWVIMITLAFGIAVAIERFFKLRSYDTDGPSFMNELQRNVLSNDIQGAIRICSNSLALLPRVLKSGLKRASHGANQIQNAIDATALEVIPKIEIRLNYLQLVANISTLFGLLGTIQGLISSFGAVSAADPSEKAALLASGIATAMNTTAFGLGTAILVMIIHTFLSSKAEKIICEIDEFSVKLLDLLGTKNKES